MGGKLVLAKIPVVIGEDRTQVLSDEQLGLEEPAVKVMDIDSGICDVTVHIIPNKVVVQAVLHKQIYFITAENVVRHQEERLPFSAVISIPGAQPHMEAQTKIAVEEPIFFRLLSPLVLEQKIVICVFVKVTDERQLYIKVKDRLDGNTTSSGADTLPQLACAFAKLQLALAGGDREASLRHLDETAAYAKPLAEKYLCATGTRLVNNILSEMKRNL